MAPSGTRTVISGRLGFPTFLVSATAGNYSRVYLHDLEITGSGVRGISVSGYADAYLLRTSVTGNAGGISVENDGLIDIDSTSQIYDNPGSSGFGAPSQGGGIRCQDSIVTLAAHVRLNQATSGGALYADSCSVLLEDNAWLIGSDADEGGGVYAIGGSFIRGTGGFEGLLVSGNDAALRGGGIYASGAGTVVALKNAHVSSNVAGVMGIGIYVTTGAIVSLDQAPGPCYEYSSTMCSSLTFNQPCCGADVSLMKAEGGALKIYRTFVEDNRSRDAALFHVSGAGSLLEMEGVQLWHNDAHNLFQVESSAQATIAFTTAARNYHIPAGLPVDSRVMVLDQASATLNSSIFQDTSGSVDTGGTWTLVNCLMVDDIAGLPAPGANLVAIGDPLFRDPDTGDLHLRVGSPAIDFCDAPVVPLYADVDGDIRGWDDLDNPNGSPGLFAPTAVYDLGFDEVVYLFVDGFESGDTSAWSSVVP